MLSLFTEVMSANIPHSIERQTEELQKLGCPSQKHTTTMQTSLRLSSKFHEFYVLRIVLNNLIQNLIFKSPLPDTFEWHMQLTRFVDRIAKCHSISLMQHSDGRCISNFLYVSHLVQRWS